MIKSVTAKNFACFRDITLPLGQLTLLTGANGTGKSAFCRALLLLLQSNNSLLLNGNGGSFGTAINIIPFLLHDTKITLGLNETMYEFPLANVQPDDVLLNGTKQIWPPFEHGVESVGAERADQEWREIQSCYLRDATYAEERVHPMLNHPASINSDSVPQAAAWLSDILPTFSLNVPWGKRMSYGVASVYQLIQAGLAAKPNSVLVIEYPELFLDDHAQSRLTAFLVAVAMAGVQVILETHSVHILNATRIAIKKGQLTPEQVVLHYFTRETPASEPQVNTLSINPNGKLPEWPARFFDQEETDHDQLLY